MERTENHEYPTFLLHRPTDRYKSIDTEMEGELEMSHVQALPEDMLAGVLRCLSPRSLAVCRCVCKAWHGVIDGHRLLRADLLPL
jgi:hypothetical protein